MKLYVCWGTFPTPRPDGHPCANARAALEEAGYKPEVIKTYGLAPFGKLNLGRKKVHDKTGQWWVPVLELDDGTLITESKNIEAWAKQNPAQKERATA
jgi:hypothetical protein